MKIEENGYKRNTLRIIIFLYDPAKVAIYENLHASKDKVNYFHADQI